MALKAVKAGELCMNRLKRSVACEGRFVPTIVAPL